MILAAFVVDPLINFEKIEKFPHIYHCYTSLFDHIHKVPPQLLGLTRMKQWSGVLQQMALTKNLETCYVLPCNKTCDIFPRFMLYIVIYCIIYCIVRCFNCMHQLEKYLYYNQPFGDTNILIHKSVFVPAFVSLLLAHLGNGRSIYVSECQCNGTVIFQSKHPSAERWDFGFSWNTYVLLPPLRRRMFARFTTTVFDSNTTEKRVVRVKDHTTQTTQF